MKDWRGVEWAVCDKENATHVMAIDTSIDTIEDVLQSYVPIAISDLARYGLPDTQLEPVYLICAG